MSRYRKIDVRIWNDRKFRNFSAEAKLLFFMLLTHPNTTQLGFGRSSLSGMAEEIGWDHQDFKEAFEEIRAADMVMYDETGPVYWIKNFLRYNPPQNPNVVVSWGTLPDLIPECELKSVILLTAIATVYSTCTKPFWAAIPESMLCEYDRVSGIERAKASPKSLFDEIMSPTAGMPKSDMVNSLASSITQLMENKEVKPAAAAPDDQLPYMPTLEEAQAQVNERLSSATGGQISPAQPNQTDSKNHPQTAPVEPAQAASEPAAASAKTVSAAAVATTRAAAKVAAARTKAAAAAQESGAKKGLPEGFCVSDDVKQWAKSKGVPAWSLDLHLEKFTGYVKANGKHYQDWDEALKNAISGNWAKLNYSKLEPVLGAGSEHRRQQAQEVFDEWRRVLNKPDSELNDDRLSVIMTRLSEGCSVDLLKRAISGVTRSAFHMGENDQRTRFDEIGLILRDMGQIDKFANMTSRASYDTITANLQPGVISEASRQTLANGMSWLQKRQGLPGAKPLPASMVIDAPAHVVPSIHRPAIAA